MPTTTRLVSALLMAALGWISSSMAISYLPEGKAVGMVQPVAAAIGALVGWIAVGRRIEVGKHSSLGAGFIGAVLMVVWNLMAFAGYEMLQRATKVQYGGPVQAIQGWVGLAIDYARDLGQVDVLLVLAVGGVLIGAISGWVSRRFR